MTGLALFGMLWYGYIYYILFLLLLLAVTGFFLRLTTAHLFYRINFLTLLFKYITGFFILFSALALNLVFTLFDNYTTFTTTVLVNPLGVTFFDYLFTPGLVHFYALDLHLTSVYIFPFVYIFILITTISVLYCLTYNMNEIVVFMFYTFFILLAGYLLFFTDSLLLFFLAYECLLVPSFFILYNFAKTRRCVEAAYLMFF